MSTTTTAIDHHTSSTVTTTAFGVEISVVTDIDAPAADVWMVLADTPSYPAWNPQITSLEGELAVGERVTVVLKLPDRKPRTMKPRIVGFEPGRSFTWLGGFGVRGLFDGRHRFEVEPVTDATCRFVHHERLSGLLVPAFRSMLTQATPEAFIAMNQALALRAAGNGS